MKIVALNPPFLNHFSRESRSPAVAKSGTLYYPMWLSYAVGLLEKQGHEVLLIDAPAQSLSRETVIERMTAFHPSMVVIDTSTPSIYNDVEVGTAIKKSIARIFIVLVGVHVSALPIETLDLDKSIDAVAFGEYDATLVEIAEKLPQGKTDEHLQSIHGLAFRASDGRLIKNPPRPFIEDLDAFPPVADVYKRHLNISPYFYGHSLYPLIVIMTGRGCPFHCTYCVVPQVLQGHKYRQRSVASIVAEFRYIRNNFPQVKEIMIEDDTLTTNKKRCVEFSQALIEAKLTSIPWSANSRADVDFETMRLMKTAGCRLFCVGFESGNQQILDNIRKGTKIQVIERFMKDAKRAEIMIHGCFMVGNRGETKKTLEETLRFAKKLNPDTAQFFPIMVYPGTADYSFYQEKGWIVSKNFRDWLTPKGLHSSTMSNPDLPYDELVRFCDRARREFYLRPHYLIFKLIQSVKNPAEGKRNVKAFFTLSKYLFRQAPSDLTPVEKKAC
ncbi:MAG: radical SAM protein [Chitinispirillaceae bacterium]|nr:radical SAM protein [Chitinispirillaceae bacterium]